MPKSQGRRDLDRFVKDLANQLLTLHDDGTGKEVGLTPFELEYVGKGLTKYGTALVERTLHQLSKGSRK